MARRAATILLVLASVPVGDVPAAGERGGAPALGRAPRRPHRWAGPVMVVNDNGAWCWFQDQRVVLTADGRLLVGSVPGTGGPGGAARAGTVEIATVEPGTGEHHVDRVQSGFRADDHDAPALIELPDRSVVAAWAAHSRERVVHVARRDPATPAWRSIPAIVATREPARAAYANLVRLAAENGGRGRLYDLFRGDGASPSALVSDDGGRTWRRAGTVLTNPSHRGASTRPYLRYASRGVDRIDFVASSGNPHEEDGSSVSVGFIQAGRVHAGSGTDLGPLDGSVRWSRLTPLRRGVAGDNATRTDTDVWTADIEEGPGGPVAALTTRLPSAPAAGAGRYDHRYQYARRTGGRWVVNELALGGGELYRAEPDYAGGVAIDPGDVDRVVISTNVNPRTGAALRSRADGRVHWELYEGVTRDQGATWTWGAVTTESSADNLRPTIVTGADGRRALLWMRGRYRSYTSYATAIVGIVRAR